MKDKEPTPEMVPAINLARAHLPHPASMMAISVRPVETLLSPPSSTSAAACALIGPSDLAQSALSPLGPLVQPVTIRIGITA